MNKFETAKIEFSKEEVEVLKAMVESDALRHDSWKHKVDPKIHSRIQYRNSRLLEKFSAALATTQS